jgi:hypothetical protein
LLQLLGAGPDLIALGLGEWPEMDFLGGATLPYTPAGARVRSGKRVSVHQASNAGRPTDWGKAGARPKIGLASIHDFGEIQCRQAIDISPAALPDTGPPYQAGFVFLDLSSDFLSSRAGHVGFHQQVLTRRVLAITILQFAAYALRNCNRGYCAAKQYRPQSLIIP